MPMIKTKNFSCATAANYYGYSPGGKDDDDWVKKCMEYEVEGKWRKVIKEVR